MAPGRPRAERGTEIGLPQSVFPVYAATWRSAYGRTASVLLLGNFEGAYLLRSVVIDAPGIWVWDGATPFPPDSDPDSVWAEVERRLDLIGAMGEWGPDGPTVIGYGDFRTPR